MKKIAFFSMLFGLLAIPAIGLALSGSMPGISGQNQTYNVLFRYNGEAVVSGRIEITNATEKDLTSILLKPKSFSARRFDVYQYVNNKEICYYARDNQIAPLELCEPVKTAAIPGYDYQVRRESGYQKLDPKLEDGNYRLELEHPLKPGEQTTLYLSYRGFGYVKQGLFGRRSFDFQNLATDDEINSVTVNVKVDTDLFFRGKRSEISYREEQYVPVAAKSLDASLGYGTYTGLGEGSMKSFVNSIDTRGEMTKTAQYLGPNETLHVKGVYATNWLGLNLYYILLPLIAIVLLAAAIYLTRRFYRKNHPKLPKAAPLGRAAGVQAENPFWENALFGFLGAILILLTIWVLFWISGNISRAIYNSQIPSGVMTLLVLIVGFLLICTSLTGLPLYAGFKYGKKSGLIVVGFQVLFLVAFMVFVILWGLGTQQPSYPEYRLY